MFYGLSVVVWLGYEKSDRLTEMLVWLMLEIGDISLFRARRLLAVCIWTGFLHVPVDILCDI